MNSDTKRHCIGQCITQATRPRSIMCPLLFGLSVELDKTFGPKWLVDHISRLSYCISYDEVLTYKHSVVESMDGVEKMDESSNFTQ